ncbi:hypothetical protein LINGRAHAP2_LOCUS1000 [Linum grandiflorum]
MFALQSATLSELVTKPDQVSIDGDSSAVAGSPSMKSMIRDGDRDLVGLSLKGIRAKDLTVVNFFNVGLLHQLVPRVSIGNLLLYNRI